jgi:hypothetical protein
MEPIAGMDSEVFFVLYNIEMHEIKQTISTYEVISTLQMICESRHAGHSAAAAASYGSAA